MNYKKQQQATRDALKPKLVSIEMPRHMIQVGHQLVHVNRKTARQRNINRRMTKKGYREGVKIDA